MIAGCQVGDRMRALSLFAGAGGGAIGIVGARLELVACIDWDKDAIATLEANHLPAVYADVRKVDWSEYRDIDIVLGGPPCQRRAKARATSTSAT